MKGSERIVYRCPKFVVMEKDFELPGDRIVRRYPFIKRGPGALILAFKENRLLLLKEYRPMLGCWVYQLPGGKIEKGEAPSAGARREIEEETGYKAKSIKPLFRAWLSPSFIKQLNYFFIARLAGNGEQELESDETIKVEFATLDDVLHMIMDGKIISMPSIAGILYYMVTQGKE
jgi:ADP-ribose pyrophosphatase